MPQDSKLEPELMVFVCGHRRDIPDDVGSPTCEGWVKGDWKPWNAAPGGQIQVQESESQAE